jgi:serine/threonine-protein kinase
VLAQVMTRILVDPIPCATQLAPGLPPAIDAFFHRALARDRAHRFQTVRELVDEFARIAGAPRFASSVSGAHGPFHPSPTGFVAGTATPLPGMPPGPGGTTPAGPLAPPPAPLTAAVSAGTLTGTIDPARPSGGRRSFAWTTWILVAGAAATVSGIGVTLGSRFGQQAEPPSAAGAPATAELAASGLGQAAGEAPSNNPAALSSPPPSAAPLVVVEPSAPVTDAGPNAAVDPSAPAPTPPRPSAPAAEFPYAPAPDGTSAPAARPTSTPTVEPSLPAAGTGTPPRSRPTADKPAPQRPPPPPSREKKPSWGIF